MWFHRKSTENQQAIKRLEHSVVTLSELIGKQLTENKANLLEFAELSEKTRRLYLRLTRRAKVDSELTSPDEPTAQNDQRPEMTNLEIREEIERKFLGG